MSDNFYGIQIFIDLVRLASYGGAYYGLPQLHIVTTVEASYVATVAI